MRPAPGLGMCGSDWLQTSGAYGLVLVLVLSRTRSFGFEVFKGEVKVLTVVLIKVHVSCRDI